MSRRAEPAVEGVARAQASISLRSASWSLRAGARCFLVLLAIVTATLVVFHPIVFSGYTFSQSVLVPAIEPRSGGAKGPPVNDPAASMCQDEPWLAFIAENLAHGELTLVNLKNGLGAPFLESLQPGALYVLNPLLLILDTKSPGFFDVFVLVHVVILVGGLYRLMRLYSRTSIALSMAVMVGLCGVTFEHLNMVDYRGFVWLPWMLEAAVRIARGSFSRGTIAQLLLATIASMTAGNAQDCLVSLGTVCTGFAIECWAWRRHSLAVRHRMVVVAVTLGAATMIGSPAVVPYAVARADGDLAVAVDPERSVTGLDPDWFLALIVPKVHGVYPDMFRAGPYWHSMCGFTTVGAFLVLAACIIAMSRETRSVFRARAPHEEHVPGVAVSARSARPDEDLSDEHCLVLLPEHRTALFGWLGFLAIALLKIYHVFVFDFVRWIPMLREVLFAKYHLFVFVALGIVGTIALEVFARVDPALRKCLLARTCAVGAAIGAALAIHIWLSPNWSTLADPDPVSVRKLTIVYGTSVTVLVASILLLRSTNPRALWLFLPMFVVQAMLLRPDGYLQRLACYYRMPEASDAARLTELRATPYSDASWDRGVWRLGEKAGFLVQLASDLRAIHAGTKLRFAGSGLREVEQVNGREVWTSGPPLEPARDGCPHPIQVVSEGDVAPPKLRSDARILTALQANQNLFTGVESVCVFNPILNRRAAELFTSWFSTFNPGFDLQVEPEPGGLTHRHLDALRFLGVCAIYGYEVASQEELLRVDGAYQVDGALPRLFLLSEDDCSKIDSEWRSVPLAKSLADVQKAIGTQSIDTTVGSRTLRFDAREALHGRLIANQAFSRAWTFEGREGRPFCGIFPSWSVNLDSSSREQAIVYWPRGLTAALWIAGAGVLLSLGMIAFVGRGTHRRKRPAAWQ